MGGFPEVSSTRRRLIQGNELLAVLDTTCINNSPNAGKDRVIIGREFGNEFPRSLVASIRQENASRTRARLPECASGMLGC